MKKFFRRIIRAFWPQHILLVSFKGDDLKIHCKEIKKLSPKRIKGIKISGEGFELVSVEPMDYYIEEYKDDLR